MTNTTTTTGFQGMDMMLMYFHFETGLDHILFKGWKPDNASEMIYSCVVVCLLTILYEAVKYIREIVHSKQIKSENYGISYRVHFCHRLHLSQSVLHALQYGLSYCLMLIAMTYQVYFLLSIIFGAAIGYAIFAPLSAKLKVRYTTVPN